VVDVSTTDSYDWKLSEIPGNKLLLRDGGPDSYLEHKGFKPHCNDTITSGNRGKLSPGAKGCGQDIASTPEKERQRKQAIVDQRNNGR